jgi:GntR family transcriptional regulator, carbon starvation induced regulator
MGKQGIIVPAAAGRNGEKADRVPPLSQQAVHILRQQILYGEIPPGQKLRVEVLQREHGLSSSPLREALSRLVAEGLVVADDHRGFRAAPMSAADLDDITNLRLVVEPAALAQSVANGDDAWEAGIVAAFHRLERIRARIAQGEVPFNAEWTERHKEFHAALIAAAGSPRLLAICSGLFDESERYRRFSAATTNRTLVRDTSAEHRRLMDSALARDGERAVTLLRKHISLTAKRTFELLQARHPH